MFYEGLLGLNHNFSYLTHFLTNFSKRYPLPCVPNLHYLGLIGKNVSSFFLRSHVIFRIIEKKIIDNGHHVLNLILHGLDIESSIH